ncbi:MAG: transcriptional repressor [Bacteroidota bacterium]
MEAKLKYTFEKVKKYFIDYLEKTHQRKTIERYCILEEVYTIDGHFDVELLYQRMKNRYQVSRATLYNTLDLLIECKLVVKHAFKDNTSHYEKSFNFSQHDHVMIVDPFIIFEFCDPRIHEIQKSLEKNFNVKITGHSLIFYAEPFENRNGNAQTFSDNWNIESDFPGQRLKNQIVIKENKE